MIQVEKTDIEGLLLIQPDIFEDERGTYVQLYDSIDYENIIPKEIKFVQEDYSYSIQNVLRGIHGDYDTAKLISIVYGSVFDVVIDNRPESSTYLKHQCFYLSRESGQQLFIPEGCGNGMLALSMNVIFHYKQTSHYTPGTQFTIKWDDERFNISWPITQPILSKRDLLGKY